MSLLLPRLALAAAALLLPSTAAAAPAFGPPATVPGVSGAATFTSATTGADGTTLLAGTAPQGDGQRPFVAIGTGGTLPTRTVTLGGAGLITAGPRIAADDAGHAAIAWARGKTVFLVRCSGGTCGRATTVGASGVLPGPVVAVQPGSGRTTVLWRGRARGGASRLQWRITTNNRLGATHTLGELGDDPQLGTDATGKSVAIWVAHAIHASDPRGLRTAARRVGAFTRPATVQSGPVADPQLATGPGGETIAAWIASPTFDVSTPSAQAMVTTRTPSRAFARPVAVGTNDSGAIALARSASGFATLALDRQLGATSAVPSAATRAPGGAFGAVAPLAGAQFVPTVFGPSAAVDLHGTATVAWSSDAGTFAARADAGAAFAAPQQLSTDTSLTNVQHPVLAASGSRTVVAWTTLSGGAFAAAG